MKLYRASTLRHDVMQLLSPKQGKISFAVHSVTGITRYLFTIASVGFVLVWLADNLLGPCSEIDGGPWEERASGVVARYQEETRESRARHASRRWLRGVDCNHFVSPTDQREPAL